MIAYRTRCTSPETYTVPGVRQPDSRNWILSALVLAGTNVNPASGLRIAAGGRLEVDGVKIEQPELTHGNSPGSWDLRARLTRENPPGAWESEAPDHG